MARHDVYPAPSGRGYLLDVQADDLGGIATRVVVPLVPEAVAPPPVRHLNPVIEVAGARHVLLTQTLLAVPASLLRNPLANLAARRDEVTRALDMLFQGF